MRGDSGARYDARVKSNIAQAVAGLLLLSLVSLAIHGTRPARERNFVYDDILVIRDSDFITHPGNLLHLFDRKYLRDSGEQTYRPVVTATYILDYQLWGLSPRGFTFTNLAIQVLAAWFLGLVLLQALPGRRLVAASSALLYLLHPALIETATVPSNREQILSVLFILLSGWTWLHRPRRLRWLSPLFLLLGCYTLEWCALWPAVLFAWAYVESGSWKKALRSAAPEIVVGGVYVLLMFSVFAGSPGAPDRIRTGLGTGLWAFGTIFWQYVKTALAPSDLRPSYVFAWPSFKLSLAGQFALWAALIAVFVSLLRRRRWAVGGLIFFLGLLPVSHIFFPFWIPLADRYLALPLVGFIPLLCALFFARKWYWGVPAVLIVASFWFAQSSAEARVWRNNNVLWHETTMRSSGDPVGWTNYGAALLAVGDNARAVAAHRIAWRLTRRLGAEAPAQASNYVTALIAVGQEKQACWVIEKQIYRFHADRGVLLLTGRACAGPDPQAAYAALSAILVDNPRDCEAWAALCPLYRAEIPACLRRAMNHCPDDPILWAQVAQVHAAVGDEDKCERAITMALSKADTRQRARIAGAMPRCRRR